MSTANQAPVTMHRVFALWWPLAGSWLLMAIEMPLLAVAMTRMPGGEVHLSAFGSLVYPISVLIEAAATSVSVMRARPKSSTFTSGTPSRSAESP